MPTRPVAGVDAKVKRRRIKQVRKLYWWYDGDIGGWLSPEAFRLFKWAARQAVRL